MRLAAAARVGRSIAGARLRRPTTPGRMVLAVTRRCNLRCAMCHTYDLPHGDEITPAEVGTLCANLPRLSWLDVTGGEIFVRTDAAQIFRSICRNTPRLGVLHFPTNGWFTQEVVGVAREVRRLRPETELIITVSVDGVPAIHDRVRGQEGSFRRAIDTFRALQNVPGVRVYIGTTLSEHNRAGLEDIRGALRESIPGFHDRLWHCNWMQISQHFFGNGGEEQAQRHDGAALARDHRRRRGIPKSMVDLMEWLFLANLEPYLRGEPVGFDCQSLHSSCFVSAEAIMYPCHVYDRPLADLRQAGFDMAAVWRRDAVRRSRRDIEALACGGCFTPCEAYPAIAGAPVRSALRTLRRSSV